MAKSEAYRTGHETRRQLMGDAMVERMTRTAYGDPIVDKFVDYAIEAVWGLLWSRPGLDMKTRTLISVVSTATQARFEELDMYLRMALRQGWTEDELTEVLLQLAGYVGLPSIREAMIAAKDVFAEVHQQG